MKWFSSQIYICSILLEFTIPTETATIHFVYKFLTTEAQIGLKMTEYNNSNDEICLTLMPVSSFNLEVLLIVDLEQAGTERFGNHDNLYIVDFRL